MQITLGFSFLWAVALDRLILVSNRKWWFGEFCFALCSCFCWVGVMEAAFREGADAAWG